MLHNLLYVKWENYDELILHKAKCILSAASNTPSEASCLGDTARGYPLLRILMPYVKRYSVTSIRVLNSIRMETMLIL